MDYEIIFPGSDLRPDKASGLENAPFFMCFPCSGAGKLGIMVQEGVVAVVDSYKDTAPLRGENCTL